MAGPADCRQKAKKFCTAKLADLFNADNQVAARQAFTLAEVLITLGVIGIVAVLTLPELIQNYKKKATVVQLKEAYSILSQAVNTSQNEHGELLTWDYTISDTDFAKKYILPYLKLIDTKKTYATGWNMYTLSTQNNMHSNTAYWHSGMIYILSNGYALCIVNGNDDTRKLITVDVNGKKGPNVLGIDGFTFEFNKKNNSLLPFGYGNTRNVLLGKNGGVTYPVGMCTRDNNWQYYRGGFCAAVIMKDGWQISDDYPWENGGLTPIHKN